MLFNSSGFGASFAHLSDLSGISFHILSQVFGLSDLERLVLIAKSVYNTTVPTSALAGEVNPSKFIIPSP